MNESELLHYLCDNKLVLYKRQKSRTDFWYARFKNEKTGKWKKFSTKTSDLEAAKKEAEAEYRALSKLIENNIAIDTKRFSFVADCVIEELEADIKAGIAKKTYHDYIRVIQSYKQFFGKKLIGNITYQDLVDYDNQRSRELGKKRKKSTINLANTALKRVFHYAVEKGWCHQSQIVTFKNDGVKGKRRPYFELKEYQRLYRYMRKYVKLDTKDSAKGGVTKQTVMIRELLRDYVLFLANTGMRHGTETRSLKWKHVTEAFIKDQKYLVIELATGKTGPRTIVCRHNVRRYLERIKSRFSEYDQMTLGDMGEVEDYVFRCSDGSTPKDFHGAFEILLKKADLLCDRNGDRRSLYSLRHTYATFQILHGKIDLHTLAKNMGTSIGMLEKHYSHLEVLHKADLLAGRSDDRGKRRKVSKAGEVQETQIVQTDGEFHPVNVKRDCEKVLQPKQEHTSKSESI